MNKRSRILISGLHYSVNSSFLRRFKKDGMVNVVDINSGFFDLTDKRGVEKCFNHYKPDIVFYTGSVSGGIRANIEYPAEFIYKNIISAANIIDSAKRSGVKKLVFFASSCVYPKNASQPIRESSLLTGPLEGTSEPYAVAKIAGIKMCSAYNKQYGCKFLSVIPATVYGPGDDFDPGTAHVIPALIARFHLAKRNGEKSVTVWGEGTQRREFIFADDLVNAVIFLLGKQKSGHINIGTSKDYAINEVARIVSKVVGFKGRIVNDAKNPGGVTRKLLDSGKINSLGWRPKFSIEKGIGITYRWFKTGWRKLNKF